MLKAKFVQHAASDLRPLGGVAVIHHQAQQFELRTDSHQAYCERVIDVAGQVAVKDDSLLVRTRCRP
jgi:hypothetical protein